MKTISILITTLLASNQILTANVTQQDYFVQFKQSLETLTKNVQPPKSQDSRLTEVSLIQPGNEADGKIYARFAGASYCSNDSIASWKCTHCLKIQNLIEDVKIFEDGATETKGYIALNKDRKEIIISFRGSSNTQNWLLNAQIGKVSASFGRSSYNVHGGFKRATDALFPVVSSNLKSLLSSYPQYNVVVTGHSLGASIADLMALRFKYELNIGDNQLRLYTYGSPRVGDPTFARFVNQNGFTVGRFVNANDVVPHLPPEINNYSHHQQELWANGMTTKLCSTSSLEDTSCSYKEWYRPSSDAHLKIWDIALGNASC